MENCIFCKIARHEIPAKIVFENEKIIAFHDLKLAAKIHVLVIPKQHSAYLHEMSTSELSIMPELFMGIQKVAHTLNIANSGYRVLINNGKDAGQEIFHVHAHVLGGEKLGPLNLR